MEDTRIIQEKIKELEKNNVEIKNRIDNRIEKEVRKVEAIANENIDKSISNIDKKIDFEVQNNISNLRNVLGKEQEKSINLLRKNVDRIEQEKTKELNIVKEEINKAKKKIDVSLSELNIKVEKFIKENSNNIIDEKNDLIGKIKILEDNIEEIKSLEHDIDEIKSLIKDSKRIILINNLDGEKENQIKKTRYKSILTKDEKEEAIDRILDYLQFEENLNYTRCTIRQFYAAMCTNQMLVLSGSPGTGKTSLVEGFCKASGIKNKIISVQPNWHENRDIIGFYNPVEKIYVSTPLIDFILEAIENSNKLHLLCFDEMNLAQTEYYLSEFLSKLETKDKSIELYSREIYNFNLESTREMLKFIIKNYAKENIKNNLENMDDSEILNLTYNDFENTTFEIFEKFNSEKNKLINYLKYGNKIKIPSNIRFCGTINKDDTTKDLSPKVVDRSIIMEIEKVIEKRENINKKVKPMNISAKSFEVKTDEIDSSYIRIKINEKKEYFAKKLDIKLNNRFDKHVREIYGSKIFDNNNEFLDMICLMKIIPKINMYIDESNEDVVSGLEELFKAAKPKSKKIFDEMKKYCENNEILTFWR